MKERSDVYKSRIKILKKSGFNSYSDFLNSSSWKLMREQRKNDFKNGRICCFCKSSEYILIHHTKYKKGNLGKNKFGGTLPVCPLCHFGIHEIEKHYNIDPYRATQIFKILYYPNGKNFTWEKESNQEPKIEKRTLSMRIIRVSGLPETLHHSIHFYFDKLEGLGVNKFIENYENKKSKDKVMFGIYIENKDNVIKYLEKFND